MITYILLVGGVMVVSLGLKFWIWTLGLTILFTILHIIIFVIIIIIVISFKSNFIRKHFIHQTPVTS